MTMTIQSFPFLTLSEWLYDCRFQDKHIWGGESDYQKCLKCHQLYLQFHNFSGHSKLFALFSSLLFPVTSQSVFAEKFSSICLCQFVPLAFLFVSLFFIVYLLWIFCSLYINCTFPLSVSLRWRNNNAIWEQERQHLFVNSCVYVHTSRRRKWPSNWGLSFSYFSPCVCVCFYRCMQKKWKEEKNNDETRMTWKML